MRTQCRRYESKVQRLQRQVKLKRPVLFSRVFSPINIHMERPIDVYTDPYGQSVEFYIPVPHRKLVINISGGADSAILLWMLIKLL